MLTLRVHIFHEARLTSVIMQNPGLHTLWVCELTSLMKLDWVLNEFTNAGVHAGLLSECFRLTLHLLQYDLHSRVTEDLLHLRVMHCTLPPLLRIVLTNALWNTSVCILYTCRSRIVRHLQNAHVISTGHNVRVMWQSCGDRVYLQHYLDPIPGPCWMPGWLLLCTSNPGVHDLCECSP